MEKEHMRGMPSCKSHLVPSAVFHPYLMIPELSRVTPPSKIHPYPTRLLYLRQISYTVVHPHHMEKEHMRATPFNFEVHLRRREN
jgi:hypothetical protein